MIGENEDFKVLDRKVYTPSAWGKPVESASDALEASALLLEEEGRWMKSNWFLHNDIEMDEYKDNPFCNGWGSCAEGALMLVTGGMIKLCYTDEYMKQQHTWRVGENEPEWEIDFMTASTEEFRDPVMKAIYDDAYKYLLDEVNQRERDAAADGWDEDDGPLDEYIVHDNVYSYNDAQGITREDVVSAMRAAARVARGEPRLDETSLEAAERSDEPAATDA